MNSAIIKKISILSLTALLLLCGAGGVAWRQCHRVLANQVEMQTATAALRNQMEADMMHDALRADVLAALYGATTKNTAYIEEAVTSLAEHAKHFREQVAALRDMKLSPPAMAAISDVATPLENYIKSAETIAAAAGKDVIAAQALMPDFLRSFETLEDKMSGVSDAIEADNQAAAAANDVLAAQFRHVLLLAVGVSILILGVLTVLVARSIPGPFRKIVRELSATAAAAGSTSINVASASQQLASGASEQAASLEETSASLEEMTSMTKRTAANATAARELGSATRSAADAGAADMQAMSEAMLAIKTSSDNIAKIIKTIDEIAFQTNLLALNAAVEAARAGESGAGFAVVADEVRALAQRSAQAAKETADKIEDSITKSQHGVAISTKVNASLTEIVGKARQMDELINEIAVATNEQSQGITQINSAISQMDRVTQSAAAGSSSVAQSAEELQAQSASLKAGIADLTKLVGEEKSGGSISSRAKNSPEAQPFELDRAGSSFNAAPTAKSKSPALAHR